MSRLTTNGVCKDRRAKKRDKDAERLAIKKRGDGRCWDCGGQMSWCSCCEVWSKNCCVDYGTCQCS